MCGLIRNIIKVSIMLAVLLTVNSSHAEISHTSKDIHSSFDGKAKEKNVYNPVNQPSDVVAVSFIENKNLKFGVDVNDVGSKVLLRSTAPEETHDDVELKAGFTYINPTNNKTKFYLDYRMLGGSNYPVLQDKSGGRDYYLDQQAKMGVKIEF